MRLTLLVCLSLLVSARAERRDWKISDFRPLTDLPWSPSAPSKVEETIEAIFREPDDSLRTMVLRMYLRQIPLEQFGTAFDKAIALERVETPDNLVGMMLPIWSERDPHAAWRRVQSLVSIVGVDDGWLNYDSWIQRNRITVVDHKAIQESSYWLQSGTLLPFLRGIEKSKLSKEEKLPIFRGFADLWFEKLRSWPRTSWERLWSSDDHQEIRNLVWAFGRKSDFEKLSVASNFKVSAFLVGMRRWLVSRPEDAPKIIEHIRKQTLESKEGDKLRTKRLQVPASFLLLWSQIDPERMSAWAEGSKENAGDPWRAKCILMGSVSETKRKRWLAIDSASEESFELIEELAFWQPALAMDLARKVPDPDETVWMIVEQVRGGPFSCTNITHEGFGFLAGYDFRKWPKEERDRCLHEAAGYAMENWGDVDIAESARFGMRCLELLGLLADPQILGFFGGENDELADEGSLIDRTFCCLRCWAIVRPEAFRKWIETHENLALREALTKMLADPWGKSPEE